MFAYIDNGGPSGDRDNWASALDFNVVTHVIRNTNHPLLVDVDGSVVVNDPDWPTRGGDAVLCSAHAHNVRVLADVDPFGADRSMPNWLNRTASMLLNKTAVTRASRSVAALVSSGGYDGVAFDWEGFNDGRWSVEFCASVGTALVSLVNQTRAALRQSNPAAEVLFAVSTNSNPWFNAAYPLDALADASDWIFVMGYDVWHQHTDAGQCDPFAENLLEDIDEVPRPRLRAPYVTPLGC